MYKRKIALEMLASKIIAFLFMHPLFQVVTAHRQNCMFAGVPLDRLPVSFAKQEVIDGTSGVYKVSRVSFGPSCFPVQYDRTCRWQWP